MNCSSDEEMSGNVRTHPQEWSREERPQSSEPPLPGVMLVLEGGQPRFAALALDGGRPIVLGRDLETGVLVLEDGVASRRHASIACREGAWVVEDLHSRNGTFVDGRRLTTPYHGPPPKVIRIGDSLLAPLADVRPRLGGQVLRAGPVIRGPVLERAWQTIARAAQADGSLHLRGESGTGKELAARAFHDHSARHAGPFVAVNCATIPSGLAERLLFGARRGAYSGATDAEGYLQAAHGGTLFLDEVAELEASVQAKLLRAIETGEVLPLGAARARTVDLRVCSATHKDLRLEVGTGRFRSDLYYRVGRPEVVLPPLRARPEEIPWLVRLHLEGTALPPSVTLVEECLLRPWPGNLRELGTEVRAAAREAECLGASKVGSEHLSVTAGVDLGPSEPSPALPLGRPGKPNQAQIEDALRREQGNVSAAARALGMHRTQLRRWLAKHQPDS